MVGSEVGGSSTSTAFVGEGSEAVTASWLTWFVRSFVMALSGCGDAGDTLSSGSSCGDKEMVLSVSWTTRCESVCVLVCRSDRVVVGGVLVSGWLCNVWWNCACVLMRGRGCGRWGSGCVLVVCDCMWGVECVVVMRGV